MDRPLAVRDLIFLTLLIAADVAESRAAVSVSLWDARAAPETADKSGYLFPLVITGGDNSGSYRQKTTWWANWHRIGAAPVASAIFDLFW